VNGCGGEGGGGGGGGGGSGGDGAGPGVPGAAPAAGAGRRVRYGVAVGCWLAKRSAAGLRAAGGTAD
jgi:hypothetical protein